MWVSDVTAINFSLYIFKKRVLHAIQNTKHWNYIPKINFFLEISQRKYFNKLKCLYSCFNSSWYLMTFRTTLGFIQKLIFTCLLRRNNFLEYICYVLKRRVSAEFVDLRGKFEKMEEGEMSGTGRSLTNYPEQENIQTTFSTIYMGRNKQRARAGVILKKQKLFSIFT